MVDAVSHDLAEPLRKIQTFGKMLVDRRVGEGEGFDEVSTDLFERMQVAGQD
jgi:light-regulated signal transduction histidine kinase (bacteriophytochrome)